VDELLKKVPELGKAKPMAVPAKPADAKASATLTPEQKAQGLGAAKPPAVPPPGVAKTASASPRPAAASPAPTTPASVPPSAPSQPSGSKDAAHPPVAAAAPPVPATTAKETKRPPAPPRGALAGVWQTSNDARIRIKDDGKNVDVELISSDVIQVLAGRLTRDEANPKLLTGILDVVFTVAAPKRYPLEVSAVIVDPNHLRLKCASWPKWSKDGKYQGRLAVTEIWMRAGDAPPSGSTGSDDPFAAPASQ
jgi:hypothetical protein